MSCLRTGNLARLNNIGWSVALLVVVTAMSTAPRGTAQVMQKGISVELAPTSSAVPVPDADNADALIITVTDTGRLYFGIDPVAPDALAEKLTSRLSRHTQSLYIKSRRQGALHVCGEGLGCGACSRCHRFDPVNGSTKDDASR